MDIKGPNLVKGIHLEGLRVLGKPEQFARYYYETGADELIYMDVVASLYNRNSLHDIIRRTAKEIFIPLAVGGGLRTIKDIKDVLRAGADKVSLNTAAINNPRIIKEASKTFGSSTIIVSIEAIRQPDGRCLAFTDNGREHTGVEVVAWAKEAEGLGAGEIFLTSIDRDGTGLGYDVELIRMVAEAVAIPVIACGGAGKLEDVRQVIIEGKADAVSIASMLHYGAVKNLAMNEKESSFEEEGNIEYLQNKRDFSRVQPANLSEIKMSLRKWRLNCRYISNLPEAANV